MTLKSYLKGCGLGTQSFVARSAQGRALFMTELGGDILVYVPAKNTPEKITQEWVSEALTWPVREDTNGHMYAQPSDTNAQSFDID